MAIVQAKKELRRRIKQLLSGVTQESIARQTDLCMKSLLSLPEYKKARAISVFLSMPSGEISTTNIVKNAFQHNKKIFIPYTYKLKKALDLWPPQVMDMVQLESVSDFENLGSDKWGIPIPSAESVDRRRNCFGGLGKSEGDQELGPTDEDLDIVIMPGMAFDRRLERVGHGKGYYDFFLQRYLYHTQKAGTKMPFLVGLGLEEQLLPAEEQVPADATDYKLDALILGSGEVLRADTTRPK
ncbi:5-formyltetrahydrofolate cyclo-ligase-like protein [Microthyrium microscopicum]|uniref:5-formyltetrahydrofolate cyclo-ligase n=1 Tax=Microthyrium microscopicum TaxID=703497 RepID=A0A6A6UM47_9PEZI|nr:5-formyltetrahydrofolate cyclo-ligase-like protein [Microthyrium microscopicum]